MQEVYEFLKQCDTYYLATADGDQPRVRPFGTYLVYEGKLYIQTSKEKPVSKQMAANPKVELCAFGQGRWVRIAGTAVDDGSVAAKQAMLDAFPMLKDRGYSADAPHMQVLYLKDATATFENFGGPEKTVRF